MQTYKIIGADQKEYGPISGDQIRKWILEGRANGQTRVCAEGTSDWKPLAEFPELASAAWSPPPSPPPFDPAAAPQPVNLGVWAAQTAAADPELRIGACLSGGWQTLQANFGLIFVATFLVWIMNVVFHLHWLPGIVFWVFQGVLYGGLYLVIIKRIRGEPATIGDTLSGFGPSLGQLLLAGLVGSLLSAIGICFLVLPGVYLVVAWIFAVPLVADKRLEFWSALELSRKVVTRIWFEVFALLILAYLPVILCGLYVQGKILSEMFAVVREQMALGQIQQERLHDALLEVAHANLPLVWVARVILLVTMPFALCVLMHGYENLFGRRKA